ncbi:glycosyltransferase family 32 protein, partial [Limosilactobacillus reuteri]
MIPKKIHFIWLGGGNFDKQSLICVNSAKRILSNYQIVIWTEKNLDLEKIANENKFLRECLKRKLWAFVSDYLRLYILYHYGGIYLDTDVQIIKPFSKEMLSKNFFAGLE